MEMKQLLCLTNKTKQIIVKLINAEYTYIKIYFYKSSTQTYKTG